MKFLLFSILFVCAYSCVSQNPNIILDENCTFDLLWKIQPESIKTYDTKGEFFYKTLVLIENDDSSQLAGEAWTRIYLLKGEYGEIPDGNLFDLGRYYDIRNINFNTEAKKLIFDYSNPAKDKRIDFEYIVE